MTPHIPKRASRAWPLAAAHLLKGALPLVTLLLTCSVVLATDASFTFLAQWGQLGTGDGQFMYPSSLAVGEGGDIFVMDEGNARVQRFTSLGTYVTQWAIDGRSIAASMNGDLLVVSGWRIKKVSSTGTLLQEWGTDAGPGALDYPTSVAVGVSGDIYVADTGHQRIAIFSANGDFLGQCGGYGDGDGQFWFGPKGVAVGPDGTVYAGEVSGLGEGANRIQRFSSTGSYLGQWGARGSGPSEFMGELGLTVSPAGRVFVVESGNHRVQAFSANGDYLLQWGSEGLGPSQFRSPSAAACDRAGNVYVVDRANCRIQKFGPLPTLAKSSTWGRLKTLFK